MSTESLRSANPEHNARNGPFSAVLGSSARLIFNCAEALSHHLDHADRTSLRFEPPDGQAFEPTPCTWLYVASYGEVVLIQGYVAALQRAGLITEAMLIICNQIELAASIRRVFPAATVVASDGRRAHAIALAKKFPPRLFIISEVPCIPGDAPCRLSPSLLTIVREQGAPTVLINGWLYHQKPASRIDRLAAALLTRDYLRNISVLGVQNPAQRAELIARGARPECVAVIGNVKFDAAAHAAVDNGALIELGRSILGQRSAFTAGCLREHDDVALVLEAWIKRREHEPNLLLVLAPRYPNSVPITEHITNLLNRNAVKYALRSDQPDAARLQRIDCLVINTLGELASVYAASTANFVGRDHNLLEALQCSVPTATTSNWNPNYPGFGILKALTGSTVIEQCDTADSLNAFLARAKARDPSSIPQLLRSLTGATDRAVELTRCVLRPTKHN